MKSDKEIKRVCLYLRYSSDKQQETSIEGQDEVCSRFCEFNGYEVVGRYIDRATSARTHLEKRVSFLRMIADSEKGLFDGIVVYKMDRFSRDQYTTALYTKKLTEEGIAIISASENLNTLAKDGGMSGFMIGIMNAFAVYYSEELSQKVSRGMKVCAERAQFNGGVVPLGYRIVDKRYEIDEKEAAIVREAFSRRAKGETFRSIMGDFNRRGIKTRRGKPFSYNSFQNLLKNERYAGTYLYGGMRIPGAIPAIVDSGTFRAVKEEFDMDRHRLATPRDAAKGAGYALTGKIYCGSCGAPMVGVSAGGKSRKTYHYYVCRNAYGKYRDPANPCRNPKLRKEEIEGLVANEARLVYKDKKLQKLFVDAFTEAFSKIMKGTVDRTALIQAEIAKAEKRKSSALDALIANPALAKDLTAKVEGISKEISDLEAQLKGHRANLSSVRIRREDVEAFLDRVFSDPGSCDAEIIDAMVQKVTCFEDGRVEIVMNISDADKEKALPDGNAYICKMVTRTGFEPMNVCVKGI